MARAHRGAIAAAVTATLIVGAVAGGILLYNVGGGTADADIAREAVADPNDPPLTASSERWGRVSIYTVIGDGTLVPPPSGAAAELWLAFTRMATPSFAADNVATLSVASSPGETIAASVGLLADDRTRWELTINLAAASRRDVALRTLVHEYAHLLSFGDGRLKPGVETCRGLALREGCVAAGTPLQRFEERFWSWYEHAPAPDSDSRAAAWWLYVDHPDAFLTVYAAMNVAEDFAETFAEFVARPRPDPRSGPWAEKLLFFWDLSDYVEARERIRGWYEDELPVPLEPSR